MCQTKSQGGKRCAAHTRPAYEAVMADIDRGPATGQTRADYDNDLAYRVDHGTEALVDYAATKTGAEAVQKDIDALEDQYERHPSTTAEQEMVRQGTLSALRVAMRTAAARNDASAAARDTNDRYSELFHDRIALQNQIFAREQTVEDSADAHAVNEMQTQLDAINAEMESMETWRRTPAPTPMMFGSGAPAKTASVSTAGAVLLNGPRSVEAVATASDEDGAADRMAWEDARGGPPEPNVDENGYLIDEHGNAWGECNSCGDEAAAYGECCDDGEVVPAYDVA
jgi:hypothetical protein